MSKYRPFLYLSLPLYLLDQASKWWIVFNFAEPRSHGGYLYVEERPVIEGFFNINRIHNTGVAFGFGNGTAWAPIVFLLIPLIALTLIVVYWKKGFFQGWKGVGAAALLVAGICGNVTDRLFQGFFLKDYLEESFWVRLSKGYVVDFIDVTLPIVNYRWPSFNVADSCIFIAAFLFFFSNLKEAKVESK